MCKPSDPAAPRIRAIIERHQNKPGALLPMLHSIQDTLGYIPDAALPPLASALQRTQAEIEGVVSFYHHFRRQPPGQHRVQICRAEACQARGARSLESHIRQSLKPDPQGRTADGRFELEAVYCLGNCACGPNLVINGRLMPDMDAAAFDRWLADTTAVGRASK